MIVVILGSLLILGALGIGLGVILYEKFYKFETRKDKIERKRKEMVNRQSKVLRKNYSKR